MPGPRRTDPAAAVESRAAAASAAAAVGGGFGLLLALNDGAGPFASVLTLAAFAVLGAASVLLVHSDLRHRRIPNRVLGPAALAFVALAVCAALVDGRPERALVGAGIAVIGFCVAALAWRSGSGIGGGDVKLVPLMLFALAWAAGPQRVFDALLLALLGLALGTGILLVAFRGRRAGLPFGPVLIGAGWTGSAAGLLG